MNNTVAIKLNAYKGFSLMEAVKGIHNAGFENLEIPSKPNNGFGYDINSSDEEIKKVKDIFDEYDLHPVSIGSSVYVLDNNVEGFMKVVRLADYFGCRYVVASVENPKSETEFTQPEKIAESLNLLVPVLKEHDLTLVMELHGRYSNGKIMKQICEAAQTDRVGINYDTGNAIYYSLYDGSQILEDLEESIDYVRYFHMKDKLGEKQQWNFPALGTGYVPFEEIFEIIRKHENNCCLTAEIEFTATGPKDCAEVDEAVMVSAQYLRNEKIL